MGSSRPRSSPAGSRMWSQACIWPANLPIGQMHTWSSILTAAIIIGIPHPLSSDRIGLAICCLLRFKPYLYDHFWCCHVTEKLLDSPFLLSFTLRSDSATLTYLLPDPSVSGFWPWLQGHLLKVRTLDDTIPQQSPHSEVPEWRSSSPSKISITPPILAYEQWLFSVLSPVWFKLTSQKILGWTLPSNRFPPPVPSM